MGSLSSRPWVPGSELGSWSPPPWPAEHTMGGLVQSYRAATGRWANPWMAGRPGVASFFYDWFLVGRDEAAIPRSLLYPPSPPPNGEYSINRSNGLSEDFLGTPSSRFQKYYQKDRKCSKNAQSTTKNNVKHKIKSQQVLPTF